MAKTIEELKKEIAEQRQRIAKETQFSKSIVEKQKLSKELFELKHKKLLGSGAKAKRLSKRFGKVLLKVGQKAAPVVKKQARLIRDQQLRDDAIARKRLAQKKKSPKKATPRNKNNLGVFGNLDF